MDTKFPVFDAIFFCFFAPISAYTKRENNFSKIERKKELLVIEEKTDVLTRERRLKCES